MAKKNEVVELITDILNKLDCMVVPENEKVEVKLSLTHFMGQLKEVIYLERVEDVKKELETLVTKLESSGLNKQAKLLSEKMQSLDDDLVEQIEDDLADVPER